MVNPNWSAPLNPRDVWNGGVGWPWTRYRNPTEPELPEPEVVIRAVPKYQNGQRTMVTLTPDYEAPKPQYIETPDGARIAVADVIRFIRKAPQVGATFRSGWNRDWSHEYWQALTEWLAQYAIVSRPEPRKTTTMLVTTQEAWAILAGVLGQSTDEVEVR